MDLKLISIEELAPAPSNVKEHDLPIIMDSMRRFGFADPLVIDARTGLLMAGHGRLEGLIRMRENGEMPPEGISELWEVPVYTGWSSADEVEADAARIALNRTTDLGGWDEIGLADILQVIQDSEQGLQGVGYTDDEVADLLKLIEAQDPFGAIDDVIDEKGDLDGEEGNTIVRIDLLPDLAALWRRHRSDFNTDSGAMKALLDLRFPDA